MSSILYDKGDIKGFPLPIVNLMLQYQEEQCGHKDVKVFEKNSSSDKLENGFEWRNTPEGRIFWQNVIRSRMFKVFFKKYPEKVDDKIAEFLNSRNSGQIEDFPKEILDIMLQKQKEAGNPENLSIFETNRCANTSAGGFDWTDTSEGIEFWDNVLVDRKYDRFFDKYLKYPYSKKIKGKEEKKFEFYTFRPFKEHYFNFENLFD